MKRLGRAGYWGWDPVENASLVPWLIQTVAIHAVLNDENGNGNARSVVVAVLSSFCLVVMAVFLTRSGVLSDVSVHSFCWLVDAFFVSGHASGFYRIVGIFMLPFVEVCSPWP